MSENQFRILVLFSFVMVFFSGAYDYLGFDAAAEAVIRYADRQRPLPDGTELAVLGVIGVIAITLTVISTIGLLLFKPWARPLYIARFLAFFVLYPLTGVSAFSGVSQVFYDLSMLASGAVLALIYFSPLARRFN